MSLRIQLNILLFIAILFLPWWLSFLIALSILIIFDGYELIGWGLFVDGLYGNQLENLFNLQYVFTLSSALLLILGFMLKKKIIYYDRMRV